MIDPKAPKVEKLAAARRLFHQLLDHYRDHNSERERCSRVYHNTKGKGQWEAADIEYLENEGRPALSFNLAKNKIDSIQGMLEDVRQVPIVRPSGDDDVFAADVHSALLDRMRELYDVESIEWEVAEEGLVGGDAALAIDVHTDPKNPSRVTMTLTPAEPSEVMWDNESVRPGREDAEFVVWPRWYTATQFKSMYPDFAGRFEEFLQTGQGESDHVGAFSPDDGESEARTFNTNDRDYDRATRMRDYVDRSKRQVRVIRIEYKCPKLKHYLVHPETGVSHQISEKQATAFQAMLEAGATEGLEIVEVWDAEVYEFDFVRDEVLFDGPLPQPFSGFSLLPFTCFLDKQDRTPYGLMRNLIDPQREFNKAHSQALEMNIAQGKPGYIAEIGAVPNPVEFEKQNNEAGGTSYVADGALTEQRIRERAVPQIGMAAEKRMEGSLMLMDRIAGIGTDLERGGVSGAEALGTVQLRYRRSQIGMRKVFKHFERFQRGVAAKMLEVLARAYPDHQVSAMLGNHERYAIENGRVLELQADPETGQQTVARTAMLRDLRNKPLDIELDTGTANNTLRLMELQVLEALARTGNVPIDPTLMVEKAVASRSERERLTEYIRQTQAAAAQGQQAQAEQLAQQVQAGFELQRAADEEKRRHNVATEVLKAREQQYDLAIDFAKLAEKATAEERKLLDDARAQVEARQFERGA